MKSKIFKSLAICSMVISLWSCKKDETQIVSNITPAGTLTASATTLNLVQANAALPALTLSYPIATSTGYVVPVTTTLQFGLKGTNFNPVREVVVTDKTYVPKISDVNSMILALGGKVNEAAQIEVRLKSGAAVNDITYSNVLTLSATPYLASAWVYVPGAYQGWKPETADSLISATSNGIYTGMIEFTAGNLEFKITPVKKWEGEYGESAPGKIATGAGGNLKSPDAMIRQVTVDLNAGTYTVATPKEWSIIGDATVGGWGTDTDMKGVNDGKSNNYSIKTTLTVGALKFRFGHDWGTNLGGSIGALTTGGDNISITSAGTYTITLDVAAKKATLVKN